MHTRNYLAMDFGASTGRGIVGAFDGKTLTLQEVYRFKNYYVDVNGSYYWDILRLYRAIVEASRAAQRAVGAGALAGIGVDTWGTDYGLLDKNGQLLGNCRCMRNADGLGMRAVEDRVHRQWLFSRTGIQSICGNTLFQLYERKLADDPALERAETLLMLPDLLTYFLTGEKYAEYTMASTSMLLNAQERAWDGEILSRLGLPQHIFPQILFPGKTSFAIRETVAASMGTSSLACIPVGTHDTASAVAAAPLAEGEAFCSSGTWSLMGMEIPQPLLGEAAYHENVSNEGCVDGRIRLLKNIMGMWILQQCMEEWTQEGFRLTWADVVSMAEQATPFYCLIDLEEPKFYSAGNMIEKIRDYCRRTNQPLPQDVGQIARCVYESIAMRYRMTLDSLELLTGRRISALRIVGGASQNALLNQFAANILGRPVYAGPVECACIGNILAQAVQQGEIGSYSQMREVVRTSFKTDTFLPEQENLWMTAYATYRGQILKH